MIAREPEWDTDDRAILTALTEYEADLCPGCGQRLSESLHVDDRPDPEWELTFAVCTGCAAKERGRKLQEDRDAKAEKSGGFVARTARRFLLRLLKPHT